MGFDQAGGESETRTGRGPCTSTNANDVRASIFPLLSLPPLYTKYQKTDTFKLAEA